MVNHVQKLLGDLKTESYRNEKLGDIFTEYFDRLKAEQSLTDEQLATFFEKSSLEFITILKHRMAKRLSAIKKIKNLPVFRKKRDVKRLRRILLAKLEGMLPDRSYRLIRSIADLRNILPSVDAIRNMRREVNAEIQDCLGMTSDETFFSCTVDPGKVLNLICRIHTSAFPNSPLPKDIVLKFSVDGRPNSGTDEVLIGIVPLNLKFPLQSGFSTFPLSILQCKESEASTVVKNTLKSLQQLKEYNFKRTLADSQITSVHEVQTKMTSDYVALWNSSELQWKEGSELEFCAYCRKRSCDVNIYSNEGVEARIIIPGLDILSKDYIFCCLHMGMRITERIIGGIIIQRTPTEIDTYAKTFRDLHYGSIRRDKEVISVAINGNGAKEILVADHKSDLTDLKQQLESKEPLTEAMALLVSWTSEAKQERIIAVLNSWSVIYRLISLQEDLSSEQVELLTTAINRMLEYWKKSFVSFMTPYLHVLFCHVVDIVKEVGSIGRYSQQGFEYANRLHRAIENRATNHGGGLGDLFLTEQVMLNFYSRYYLALELGLINEVKHLLNRKIDGAAKKTSHPRCGIIRKKAMSRKCKLLSNRTSPRPVILKRGRKGPKQFKKKKETCQQLDDIQNSLQAINIVEQENDDIMEYQVEPNEPSLTKDWQFPMDVDEDSISYNTYFH